MSCLVNGLFIYIWVILITEPDFWKKFLIWRYSQKGLQISPKSHTLIFFSKTALKIVCVFGLKLVPNSLKLVSIWLKPIFQKNLQFGYIWPWNRQKIAQFDVFGHFLDFASLLFFDFAYNGRWTWCLLVFLQFAGPVNVFLFYISLIYCEINEIEKKI